MKARALAIATSLILHPIVIASAAGSKEWTTFDNCELVPNASNDGDSFHLRANGTEYLVRLYLIDAPETKSVGVERLVEQSEYFGITVPEVIEVGKKAAQFVQAKLSEPFTVHTRMASGLGRSNIQRFYAFVRTKNGEDLGELLVANGLARIHGMHAAPPGVSTAAEELQKLDSLEQKARQAKLGGWALSAAAANVHPTTTPAQVSRSVSPTPTSTMALLMKPPAVFASPTPQPLPLTSGNPLNSGQMERLDINTSSKEQLQKVPGIGEVIAERIIAARPFQSADDLKKVKGVGSGKRYQQLRPFFR